MRRYYYEKSAFSVTCPMKSIVKIPVGFAIFLALIGSSHALLHVADLSALRAKKMGIVVTPKASGPKHVRVEIEFKREGGLKNFDPKKYGLVEMRLRDKDASVPPGVSTLTVAPLQMKQPKPGRVSVFFTARRDQVGRMNVMIHVLEGLSMVAFNLELKKFVNVDELDKSVVGNDLPAAIRPEPVESAADVKAN